MYTYLVILHVVSMIASMGLMTSAVGMGLFGNKAAARIATAGFVSGIAGFVSGSVLLLDSPLTIECAMLVSYLIGVTILYRYGFAFGNAAKARLVRQS